uniref:Terpene synthase metal-binding domain-containing protein n=1 Tax=Lactuca sativa TaxID=4236 RepID=A0A9R1V5E4_LACSA|nr:hypothetical protein LSAT_V11C600310950 [Lactuca sativa]
MVRMLNLHRASYHSFDDESILDDIRDFTTKYLQENLEKLDGYISSLVTHALELPLHWRLPRVEAKWFMAVYEKRSDINPTLIELAKLDFNMIQAIHIEDLKHSLRWKPTSENKKNHSLLFFPIPTLTIIVFPLQQHPPPSLLSLHPIGRHRRPPLSPHALTPTHVPPPSQATVCPNTCWWARLTAN